MNITITEQKYQELIRIKRKIQNKIADIKESIPDIEHEIGIKSAHKEIEELEKLLE